MTTMPIRERVTPDEGRQLVNILDEALHRPGELTAFDVSFANNLYIRWRTFGERMKVSARERNIMAHLSDKLEVPKRVAWCKARMAPPTH